jgi:DNA modification methylase
MPRKTTAPLGAKPEGFCRWILDALGWQEGDTLDDIFPGSGMMGAVTAQGTIALVAADDPPINTDSHE